MIELSIINCGSLRVSKKYVISKEDLGRLCHISVERLVIVDGSGEEIPFEEIQEGRKYVVVDEKEDLESEEEEEEKEIKRKHALFHQKQQRISKMQEIRRSMIAKLYQPRHPNMYPQMGMYTVDRHRFELDEKAVFDPSFLQAFHTRQWNSIIKKETATNIYSCPLFTMAFCTQFMEEIHHFRDESGLPMLRPNSMHHYGVLLSEMGFDPFLTVLRETYIKPLCQFLYGELGMQIDSNHAFVVEYKIGVDEKLDMHYDDSEITLNCCMGDEFEGGSLEFSGILEDESTYNEHFTYHHVPTRAILHVGKHRHAATQHLQGERMNVIIWYRSTALREQRHDCVECCGHEHK